MKDLDDVVIRWSLAFFAVTVAPACLAYVYMAGKRTGRSGRIRMTAYRCIAAQLRHPTAAIRLAAGMVGVGFLFAANERIQGVELTPVSHLLISGGMAVSVYATFGVAAWRGLFWRQHAIGKRDGIGPVDGPGVGGNVPGHGADAHVPTGQVCGCGLSGSQCEPIDGIAVCRNTSLGYAVAVVGD